MLWAGGWLHTRDLATMDEVGHVKIADRAKDAVKSGGEWISTINLEDILMRHPSVLEAAVIGVSDDQWGEETRRRGGSKAGLKTGSSRSQESLSELRGRRSHCKVLGPRQMLHRGRATSEDQYRQDRQKASQGQVRRFKKKGLGLSDDPAGLAAQDLFPVLVVAGKVHRDL